MNLLHIFNTYACSLRTSIEVLNTLACWHTNAASYLGEIISRPCRRSRERSAGRCLQGVTLALSSKNVSCALASATEDNLRVLAVHNGTSRRSRRSATTRQRKVAPPTDQHSQMAALRVKNACMQNKSGILCIHRRGQHSAHTRPHTIEEKKGIEGAAS